MSDETKKVEESTKEESTEEAQASEQKTEEVAEESQEETKTDSQNIDFKAELEAELVAKNKRLEQAEFTIKKLKKKNKSSDDVDESDDDEYSDAQRLSAEEIREIIREENQVFYNKSRESELKREIRNNASSDDEADLIFYHFSNSIRTTGDDAKDIANAKLLANGRRWMSQLSETARSARARANVETDISQGQRRNENEGTVRLTAKEEKLANNFDPDGSKGIAKKMLEEKKNSMV